MTWWLAHNFEIKKPFLQKRVQMIKSIREFFDDQGFDEVETPILQICPTVDVHIHGFETQMIEPDLKTAHTRYLQTSPEFEMKKLLVAGMPKIYQICKVFRNGEGSRLHSAEFTMLEWYRAHADYNAIMDDCVDLFRHIAQSLKIKAYEYRGQISDPFKEWQKITIAEAFQRYVDIDLEPCLEDLDKFKSAIKDKGIRLAEDDTWDDLFFRVMAEKIEPHLGAGVPCILYEYPACMASLSRKKPDDPRWAERFEVYVCGVELANAFSELTDAAEQRARIEADLKLKQDIYGFTYPVDEEFLKALEHGMPESGGIALGIDRLAMLASGADDINQIQWCGVLR